VGDGEGLFGAKRRDDATGCVVYTQVCAARPKQASQRQEARERQAETTVEKNSLFLIWCVSYRERLERESKSLFQLNLNNQLKRILINESFPVTDSTCIHVSNLRA